MAAKVLVTKFRVSHRRDADEENDKGVRRSTRDDDCLLYTSPSPRD